MKRKYKMEHSVINAERIYESTNTYKRKDWRNIQRRIVTTDSIKWENATLFKLKTHINVTKTTFEKVKDAVTDNVFDFMCF